MVNWLYFRAEQDTVYDGVRNLEIWGGERSEVSKQDRPARTVDSRRCTCLNPISGGKDSTEAGIIG